MEPEQLNWVKKNKKRSCKKKKIKTGQDNFID